jgi:hypothetical protein
MGFSYDNGGDEECFGEVEPFDNVLDLFRVGKKLFHIDTFRLSNPILGFLLQMADEKNITFD